MDATTVAPQVPAQAGDTTVRFLAADERYQKLLKLRNLQQQLARLEREAAAIEAELLTCPDPLA